MYGAAPVENHCFQWSSRAFCKRRLQVGSGLGQHLFGTRGSSHEPVFGHGFLLPWACMQLPILEKLCVCVCVCVCLWRLGIRSSEAEMQWKTAPLPRVRDTSINRQVGPMWGNSSWSVQLSILLRKLFRTKTLAGYGSVGTRHYCVLMSSAYWGQERRWEKLRLGGVSDAGSENCSLFLYTVYLHILLFSSGKMLFTKNF